MEQSAVENMITKMINGKTVDTRFCDERHKSVEERLREVSKQNYLIIGLIVGQFIYNIFKG